MIGIMMMMRSVIVSRMIWIDSLRKRAMRRAKEKAFMLAPPARSTYG